MAKKARAKAKKFIVDVNEVWCRTVEVELTADATWQQIIDAARTKIAESDEGETEYSHLLVPETWNVRDEHGGATMHVPDGAKPAVISIVFDPTNREQPWAVEDHRQTLPNVTRHRSKAAVLERLVDILAMVPPDSK